MSVLHGMDNDQLSFKSARMASCMERLLVPDFAATDLHWLIHRVLGTDNRIQGSDVLPPTKFRTEDEANSVWERVAIELDERGTGLAT